MSIRKLFLPNVTKSTLTMKHSSGETEEYLETLEHNSQSPSRDSKKVPLGKESGAVPLHQPAWDILYGVENFFNMPYNTNR